MVEREHRVRERILQAAARILHESGARRLTQPAVARAAGIRQSHLTYYFPRRADLMAAMTARFIETVSAALERADSSNDPEAPAAAIEALAAVILDRRHMRNFLSLVLEAEQDETLRAMLLEGTRQVAALVAQRLGRPPGDPDVALLHTLLRGLGIQSLLMGGSARPATRELVARLGLATPTGR
jgi:AcrR family transcriptional regulator